MRQNEFGMLMSPDHTLYEGTVLIACRAPEITFQPPLVYIIDYGPGVGHLIYLGVGNMQKKRCASANKKKVKEVFWEACTRTILIKSPCHPGWEF